MSKKTKKTSQTMPLITMQVGEDGAEAVVDVTGVIGIDDAQCLLFADDLKRAVERGAERVVLRVNSPGGDVFSALAMYDAISSCTVPVRAEVHGLAASAASLICMAADEVAMSESARFMVHQPTAGVWGTPDEVMNYAVMLKQERERMFEIYGQKCGKSWEEVSGDHQSSVYYTAEEAIEYGFVDTIIQDSEEDLEVTDEADETEEDLEVTDEADETEEDPEVTDEADESDEDLEVTDEADESDEDETESISGMTGKRERLLAAADLCMRVFGLRQKKTGAAQKVSQARVLAVKNQRLRAMNHGLQVQLEKLKAAGVNQGAVVAALVDHAVTARLAALGVSEGDLPSGEESTALPSRVSVPSSRAEFLKLSVDERLAVIGAHPESVVDWL